MRLRALCRLRLAFLGGQGEDSGLMATTVIHVRDMREGDVYIGHRNNRYGLPESIWANPHYKDDCSQEEKVERFEAYLKKRPDLLAHLAHSQRQATGLLVQAEGVSRRCARQTGRRILIRRHGLLGINSSDFMPFHEQPWHGLMAHRH